MAKNRLCSIPDCGKPVRSRGWCNAHYLRWLIHRDLMAGVPIQSRTQEPLRWIYEVALPYAGDDCLPWPFAKNSHGYGTINLEDGTGIAASRYLCIQIHGEPETPDHHAAHSCGNGHRGCMTPCHLIWKTRIENEADKLKHGTLPQGETHGLARLTEPEVREIRALKGIMTQQAIAEKFGIRRKTVGAIQRRERWAFLD